MASAISSSLLSLRPKPPPNRKTQGFLIVLDLASIFELVTCTKPTRRNHTSPDSQPYGPFWNFAQAVWLAVHNSDRGLQSAIRTWADEEKRQTDEAKSKICEAEKILGRPLNEDRDKDLIYQIMWGWGPFSTFVGNLQFRHRLLWQKLTPPPQ